MLQDLTLPAGQAYLSVTLVVEGQAYPASHAVQLVWPPVEYSPEEQATGAALVVEQLKPAGQVVQEVALDKL